MKATAASAESSENAYEGLTGDIYSDWADAVSEACDRARARDDGFIEIREKTDNHDYTSDDPQACTDEEWAIIAEKQAENEHQLWLDVCRAFTFSRYGLSDPTALPLMIQDLCTAFDENEN